VQSFDQIVTTTTNKPTSSFTQANCRSCQPTGRKEWKRIVIDVTALQAWFW